MSELLSRFANLSPEQRKLLLKKMQERGLAPQPSQTEREPPPLAPVPRDADLPLSFPQQRLWFIDQWEPGSAAYNICSAVRFSGALDLRALARSLRAVVRRHEILRTSFPAVAGRPYQRIAPALRLPLPLCDLRDLPAPRRAALARRMSSAEAHTPFDLARGPLLRVGLLRLAGDDHLLLVTLHHIIADGWSVAVFTTEVAALYQASIAQRPAALPDLPIQYADYAAWQHAWLQGAARDQQLDYWRDQLAGAPPILALPTDHPRPAVQVFHGATLVVSLPAPLLGALQALSQRGGTSLFTTLLAGFAALLSRYARQDDLVIGAPIAGRTRVETEPLIGMFVNTLALRADLRGTPTVDALLGRLREVTLGAYAHQDLPFERIVEALQPTRDLSRQALFQVMFVLQNTPDPVVDLEGLRLKLQEVESGTANFDLSLGCTQIAGVLRAEWEYNTDLFERATIERMARHFQTLLGAMADHPTRPAATLPLLTVAEAAQLVLAGAGPQDVDIADAHVHELFAARAGSAPDAIAVAHEDILLSYGELNLRANRLADHLGALRLGAGAYVGLCVTRSPDLLIGLLGILKAGYAYVPLDPDYPQSRIAFVLNDTQAAALVTQEHLLPKLPPDARRVIRLDTDWPLIARARAAPRPRAVTSNQLAYILYTSGSTGQPKGVMISHRALTGYIQSTATNCAITAHDRLLLFASISFDSSAEEIFASLTRGATLLLRTESMLDSVATFLDTCHRWSLTLLDPPTAYWHEVTHALARTARRLPPTIRLVFFGGEQARSESVLAWRQLVPPQVRLMNGYGPTETTIVATQCDLSAPADPFRASSIVPIGRAVANAQTYVLDRFLHLAPPGAPGELAIGGRGVAQGYLNQPALSAEKFIPDPFGATPGARLYRTGDLVRYRADGALEYLGRIDQQLKIRGFRVEPEEIEALLSQHPAVQEAVVIAQDDRTGAKFLAAYVVPATGDGRPALDDRQPAIDDGMRPDPSPIAHRRSSLVSDLRSFLRERLPEYMTPSAFVLMDALPLTINGKVDRRALAAREDVVVQSGAEFVAPRDPLETLLARIWAEALGRAQVGVHDQFFELGGHSLLAAHVLARIRETAQVDLSLRALFETPTIAGLAGRVRQAQIGGPRPAPGPADPASEQPAGAPARQVGLQNRSALVPIQPGGSKQPFFCVHPVGGGVICYAELSRHLGADQPFYGLEAIGLGEDQSAQTRIEEMAATYIGAIQAVQPHGPYRLGGWSFGGAAALEMARQLQQQGQEVALLALFDSWAPIAPEGSAQQDDAGLLLEFIEDIGGITGKAIDGLPDRFPQAPDEQLRYIIQQARAIGLVPPSTDDTYVHRLFEVYKSNYRALERYQARPYAIPTFLFRADKEVAQNPHDTLLGWDQLCTAAIEVRIVPGDHYSMLTPPHVSLLAEQLKACLESQQAQARLA